MTKSQFPIPSQGGNDQARMTGRHWSFRHLGLIGHWSLVIGHCLRRVSLPALLLAAALSSGTATAGVQHIYFVHTNDIHGALLPTDAYWIIRDFPPPLANAP